MSLSDSSPAVALLSPELDPMPSTQVQFELRFGSSAISFQDDTPVQMLTFLVRRASFFVLAARVVSRVEDQCRSPHRKSHDAG